MSPNGPADGPPPAAPETVLGVPPGATEREIDLAWRAYVKRHHPDAPLAAPPTPVAGD